MESFTLRVLFISCLAGCYTKPFSYVIVLTPSAAQGADISEALDMEGPPDPWLSLRLKLYGPPDCETMDSCVSFFLFP